MINLAAKLPRTPLDCIWLLTYACNLRCIHCESDSGNRRPGELTLDEALKTADELAELGCKRVSLSGGEPLLYAGWNAVVKRLAEREIDPTIITNGLLVNRGAIDLMIASRAFGAAVSLDGDQEIHDSIRVSSRLMPKSRYEAAVNAISMLVESPLKTAVITQVNRLNLGILSKMYKLLVDFGIDCWQVQIAMPLGRLLRIKYDYLLRPSDLPELIEKLASFSKDGRLPIAVADNIGYYGPDEPVIRGSLNGRPSFYSGCMAGCRLVSICPNGDVKGCPSHPIEFAAGNLREESLAKIWSDRSRFAYNTGWDDSLMEGECAKCPYRRVCRAGCTSMAYAVTGTIYNNPFCLQHIGAQKQPV